MTALRRRIVKVFLRLLYITFVVEDWEREDVSADYWRRYMRDGKADPLPQWGWRGSIGQTHESGEIACISTSTNHTRRSGYETYSPALRLTNGV